jgi:hypothetical protein
MQSATIETISRILAADPNTTPEQAKAVLAACESKQSKRRLGTKVDAALILGLHPESIKRYARKGLLHPVRITSRRVRYDLDEVQRLRDYGVES